MVGKGLQIDGVVKLHLAWLQDIIVVVVVVNCLLLTNEISELIIIEIERIE